MALPKTDSFTSVGGEIHLHDYDVNWKDNNGAVWGTDGATDNAYVYTSGTDGESAAHWEGDVFNDNQYAQAKIVGNGGAKGAAVRVASGSTGTYYGFYADGTNHYLFKYISGWTQIGSNEVVTGALDEIIYLEVSGTSLTPKIDGGVWSQGVKTDDAIDSGYAGMTAYNSGPTVSLDDFEGGDLEDNCTVETIVTTNTVQSDVITVVAMEG